MSLQQGGFGDNGGSSTTATNKKANMNPTSIDAMFQGILPTGGGSAVSPANPRQLSTLNSMNLGPISATAAGTGVGVGGGMMVHQPSSSSSAHRFSSQQTTNPNSLNSSNLGEEIKRLQQLHQLSSAGAPSSSSSTGTNTMGAGGGAGGGTNNQQHHLMQGLLAGGAGTTNTTMTSGMSNLGVKNPGMLAAHQTAMLQSLNQQSGGATSTSANSSTLNSMNLGPISATAAGTGVGVGGGMMVHQPSSSSSSSAHRFSSQQTTNPNSLNSSNLSEEIKRLQQLHQLSSAGAPSSSSTGTNTTGTGGGADAGTNSQQHQLMQGLLAGTATNTTTASDMSNLGVKNPGMMTAHQTAMLQALNQQHQQQLLLHQQLVAGGGLNPTAAAQLIQQQHQLHHQQLQQQQLLPSPSMLSSRAHTAGGVGTFGSAAGAGGLGRPGPGAIEPFPEKLHRMLTEVEVTGRGHIISFVDDGRAFAIHKPNQFFKEIVPLYFRQSRLSSFKRQLNLYGFELISNGPSRGAYYHELFQRDKPNLCRRMRRVAVKVSKKQEGAEEAIVSPHKEGAAGAVVATGDDSADQ